MQSMWGIKINYKVLNRIEKLTHEPTTLIRQAKKIHAPASQTVFRNEMRLVIH